MKTGAICAEALFINGQKVQKFIIEDIYTTTPKQLMLLNLSLFGVAYTFKPDLMCGPS